nr:VCBS repeat-containing protein [Streptacidiphilus jeojiense]
MYSLPQPTHHPCNQVGKGSLIGNPVGFLDDSGMTVGKLYVRGWAIDPDTTSAITVHTYIDGNLMGATTANTYRPDVGTAYPGYGDNHGYYAEYTVGVGTHQVCTYAINTGAGDGNPQLPSCKSVQVVDPNPDYNGDGFSDLAILHQVTDGGADLHMLFGSTSPLSNSGTWLCSLAGSAGWSWSNMKAVTGDFNGNGYQDLAILAKRTDGGADVHVLYGGPGSSPLGNTTTITRSLPGPGWDWTKMKVTAGDTTATTSATSSCFTKLLTAERMSTSSSAARPRSAIPLPGYAVCRLRRAGTGRR